MGLNAIYISILPSHRAHQWVSFGNMFDRIGTLLWRYSKICNYQVGRLSNSEADPKNDAMDLVLRLSAFGNWIDSTSDNSCSVLP